MKSRLLFFNTTNDYKWEEAALVAREFPAIQLKRLQQLVVEVNSLDLSAVGKQKVLNVFREIQIPVFVEHGALDIDYLRGLPGPLSKPFWDTLEGDICDLVPPDKPRGTVARSVVAYCDGRKVHIIIRQVSGSLADTARGSRLFQWDPVFVPQGSDKTYAQMSVEERAQRSQAALAYRELFTMLSG